jgi:hypothetical protein
MVTWAVSQSAAWIGTNHFCFCFENVLRPGKPHSIKQTSAVCFILIIFGYTWIEYPKVNSMSLQPS